MPTWYALCHGAGIRLCSSCIRHVDFNPRAATAQHQPFVSPTTNDRCANWKAKRPTSITPTDSRG